MLSPGQLTDLERAMKGVREMLGLPSSLAYLKRLGDDSAYLSEREQKTLRKELESITEVNNHGY